METNVGVLLFVYFVLNSCVVNFDLLLSVEDYVRARTCVLTCGRHDMLPFQGT